AYYVPSAPGVGYFKVDTDVYHMFKTALISVPYVPAGEQASLRSKLRQFTPVGKLVKYPIGDEPDRAKPNPSQGTSPASTPVMEEPSDLHTEMDVVIEHLSHSYGETALAPASSQQSHHPVHQVWLPPMPKQLPLSAVLQKCGHQELDGSNWSKQPPLGTL